MQTTNPPLSHTQPSARGLLRQRPAVKESNVPKRVLVVEDERDVAELVSTVLSMEGFEAYISSGPQALADALSFQPDVVLLDLMMPEVDGFEVARRLRAHQVTEGLPIVVMTAMHDAALRAKQIGTELFLPKPFDINELVRIVEEAALA